MLVPLKAYRAFSRAEYFFVRAVVQSFLTMKPMLTNVVADEMFPDGEISDEVAVETSSSSMQLADLTANEKMVHADFYNKFDDLFDDENLD